MKIVIEDYILKRVGSFNYLKCNISSNYDNDINSTLTRFSIVCNHLGTKLEATTRVKLYKMVVSVVMYTNANTGVNRRNELKI